MPVIIAKCHRKLILRFWWSIYVESSDEPTTVPADIKVGDVIEGYEIIEVKQKL